MWDSFGIKGLGHEFYPGTAGRAKMKFAEFVATDCSFHSNRETG